MCTRDPPDMSTLCSQACGLWALGRCIRQTTHVSVQLHCKEGALFTSSCQGSVAAGCGQNCAEVPK